MSGDYVLINYGLILKVGMRTTVDYMRLPLGVCH
jgi:hypothetical protein